MPEDHKVYVGCGLVILNPDKTKVLLSRRKKEPDMGGWQLPGGTVDYANGENALMAVAREGEEETGIKIKNPQFLCMSNTFYYGKERPIHIGFVASVDSEEIPPNPEPHKAEDWQWFYLDQIPEGKWFRMSKLFVEFYKKLKQEPNLSTFFVDEEFK